MERFLIVVRPNVIMAKARYITIRAESPELHKTTRVAEALGRGAVVLLPTDSVYAVACDPRQRDALARLRLLRPGRDKRPLTLLCHDLSVASRYAHLDDDAFKLIRSLAPGPYTFLLRGTKAVPKLVLDPKRRQAGLRIPDAPLVQALLEQLDGPLVSASARLQSGDLPAGHWELFEEYENQVDLIIDDEQDFGRTPSTVIDMITPEYQIIREGLGLEAVEPFII